MNQWPPPRPALPPGYVYADELGEPLLPPGAEVLVPGELPLDTGPPPLPAAAVPTPGGFGSSESEWDSVNTIRWGNADGFGQAAAAGAPFVRTTQQLVHTKTPRPIVWLVQLNARGLQVPAGEVAPITVTFSITFGCGSAQTTMTPAIVLTAANGYNVPAGTAPPQFFVPAADMQVTARITYTPTVTGQTSIEASTMCAPWAVVPGRGPQR